MVSRVRNKLPEWTERSIQRVLNAQYMPRGKYITNNLYLFDWESDYAAMTLSGMWHEVEIKISLADFKNDFTEKRDKHHILKYGRDLKGRGGLRPNSYSFAVPAPMVDKVKPLIPIYAGLLSISANNVMEIVKPPVVLHRDKVSAEDLRLTDKFYYNMITWKEKYGKFTKDIAAYRAQINSMKAEFKAVTGRSFKTYLKDAL